MVLEGSTIVPPDVGMEQVGVIPRVHEGQVVAGVPRLFVGQVPLSKHEQDLLPFFSKYGLVDKITLVRGPDHKSRGCCMVQYKRWSDAEAAMESLNGVCPFEDQALGKARPLFVQFANPRRAIGHMNGELAITAKKLFVGQVHKDATEEQLMELFSKFGAVEKITLSPKSNRADSSYTFAFIRFKKWASCEAAIEALHEKYTMHGMDHPLVVKFADARKESMSHHHHQQQQHHQHVAEIKGPANSIPIQNVRQEQGGGNIIHVAANALPTNGTGLQHDPRPISNTTMRHPGPFRHMEQNGEFPLPHPFQSHPYPHQFSTFGGMATPTGRLGAQALQQSRQQGRQPQQPQQGWKASSSTKQMNQNGKGPRGLVAAHEAGSSSDSLVEKAESDASEGLYSLGQLSNNSVSPMMAQIPPVGLLRDHHQANGMHPFPPASIPPHPGYFPPNDARLVGFQPYMMPSIPPNPFFPRPVPQKLGLGVKDSSVYSHKLFIGQVPGEADEYDLWNIFAPCGEILELVVLRSAGISKGCAFLTFATRYQALYAIQVLNGMLVSPTKRLVVKFADQKTKSSSGTDAASATADAAIEEATNPETKSEIAAV